MYKLQILIKVSIIAVIIYAVTCFQCWSLNSSSSWSAYISFCLLLTKLSFWFERCEFSELSTSPCSMLDVLWSILHAHHQNENLRKLASNYFVRMKWKPLLFQNKISHLVKLHVTHGLLMRSSLYAETLTRKICFSLSDLCREWYIDHRSRSC